MVKKWYFKYDPEKGNEFIPGAIRAEEQPENATDVEPTGFHGFPKWNESTKKWEGELLEDWLKEQKANQGQQVDSVQTQMVQMYQSFMQQQALANARDAKNEARIKALEEELKGGKS